MSDGVRYSLAVLALAALIVTGVPAAVFASAATATTSPTETTLGTDIGINSDAAYQDYQDNGYVTRNVTAPDLSITISESREHVGLAHTANPLRSGVRNDFIRIRYTESIGRTLKIPISSDYWNPYPRDDLAALNSTHTADYKITQGPQGGNYTLLVVTFKEPGTAVFPVPEDARASYSAMERVENVSSGLFGIDLGLTKTPWNYIPADALAGSNVTVRIETNTTHDLAVEYNAGTSENPVWLKAPREPKDGVPVYRMKREGVENAVYVVSRTEEPVALRYKHNGGIRDSVAAAIRDAKQIPDRILDSIGIDIQIPL